jgi:hypothetical protein
MKERGWIVMVKFYIEQSSLYSRHLPGLTGYNTGMNAMRLALRFTLFHLITVFNECLYYSTSFSVCFVFISNQN